MKVSYVERLATYDGPESCVRIREVAGEALAGVRVGRVSSRVIHGPRRRRPYATAKAGRTAAFFSGSPRISRASAGVAGS